MRKTKFYQALSYFFPTIKRLFWFEMIFFLSCIIKMLGLGEQGEAFFAVWVAISVLGLVTGIILCFLNYPRTTTTDLIVSCCLAIISLLLAWVVSIAFSINIYIVFQIFMLAECIRVKEPKEKTVVLLSSEEISDEDINAVMDELGIERTDRNDE